MARSSVLQSSLTYYVYGGTRLNARFKRDTQVFEKNAAGVSEKLWNGKNKF